MHFLFKDPNEQAAQGLPLMDDTDIIHSPKDGAMVAVAQHQGVHVCWYCGDQFIPIAGHAKEGVEVSGGEFGTRVLLHRRCVGKKPREHRQSYIAKAVDYIQSRRFAAKATKPFLAKDK